MRKVWEIEDRGRRGHIVSKFENWQQCYEWLCENGEQVGKDFEFGEEGSTLKRLAGAVMAAYQALHENPDNKFLKNLCMKTTTAYIEKKERDEEA